MVSRSAWLGGTIVCCVLRLVMATAPIIPTTTITHPPRHGDDRGSHNNDDHDDRPLLPGVGSITQSPRCHIHGTASSLLDDRRLSEKVARVRDVVQCQAACRAVSQCQSYAFTLQDVKQNCVFYMAQAAGNVMPFPPDMDYGVEAGWWFSDKYPAQGVDYCYRRANGNEYRRRRRW